MADIDIDSVSDHNKLVAQPNEQMGETIPLTPGGVVGGGSTWEPEQETFSQMENSVNQTQRSAG